MKVIFFTHGHNIGMMKKVGSKSTPPGGQHREVWTFLINWILITSHLHNEVSHQQTRYRRVLLSAQRRLLKKRFLSNLLKIYRRQRLTRSSPLTPPKKPSQEYPPKLELRLKIPGVRLSITRILPLLHLF